VDDLTGLVLAAQRGESAALAALIRQAQPDVWRLCSSVAGRHRADDLTQETFVRAWRALPRYEARASGRTWLLAIARNTSIDALRTAQRRPLTTPLQPEVHDHAAPDASGSLATRDAFARLEPDRRTALFLTQVLGLSYAEAAHVCDVPVGTIRSRVWRAREDLAAALELRLGDAGDG
jgi:RNA polymerase sigma-70 factor (ECF subfamily)